METNFIHDGDEDITFKELKGFIAQHQERIKEFERMRDHYESAPAILDLPEKEEYKPDNRLVVNFAKYIIDTYNGFFSGIPPKLTHENENVDKAINDFWRHNDMDDAIAELSKITSTYGVGYLFLWQDEDAVTRATYNRPFDMFVIYDDTIEMRVKYGVRYRTVDGEVRGTLYSADEAREFNKSFGPSVPNPFPIPPIIEFVENDEQQSLVKPVETLIDAYDKAISEKANDVDYFADAYLAILGAELDEEGTDKIRDNRIINLFGMEHAKEVLVQFLDKPDGDKTQENLLDRIERLIYHTSMVANINDESFGNASGVALEFKLQPMKNLASMKERKFVKSLNQVFKCYTSLVTNVSSADADEWRNIKYTFIRNIPRNIQDEATTARQLEGVVSRATQLSTLSIVDDVEKEIDRIEEERPQQPRPTDYPDARDEEDEGDA